MTTYRIIHKTIYRYEDDVSLSHNEARLLPRNIQGQFVIESNLRISPWPTRVDERLDYFGNRVHYFSLEQSHRNIEVTAESLLRTAAPATAPAERLRSEPTYIAWDQFRDALRGDTQITPAPPRHELADYLGSSPMAAPNAEAADYAAASFTPGRALFEACNELNVRINQEFTYDSKFSKIGTPLTKILKHQRGVCQDFAHLFLAAVRRLGLPARYVSGYLETKPPPGKPKLQGADASHAWVSVFIPPAGWVDFDPTNGVIAGDSHIVLGYGRDYTDVTPLKGVIFGGGKHTVKVEVDVIPVEEEANVV